MRNKNIPPYYVINWDFNQDSIEYYNIMPYLVDCWKDDKKHKTKWWQRNKKGHLVKSTEMPKTFDEIKEYILMCSMHRFWARCEYEVIVTGWPQQKHKHKLDVYEQIKMNIDVITRHFMMFLNKQI